MASMPSTTYDSEGRLPTSLFGYEVLDFIGEGAGSAIYCVSHPETKQLYALKHVQRRTDRHVRFIDQLETEFEVGKRVHHPALRRSLEVKLTRNLLRKVTEAGLVMELIDGQPMDLHPPDDIAGLVEAFIQTADGLHALHEMGYVHCDLKPNNILCCTDGSVKIIDLGQACHTGTRKERIQGTPDFISPEQVKCLPVTLKTDVFNLGATMYWALAGRKLPTLFNLKRGDNSFLLDASIPSVEECNPNVPHTLSNLVMECVRTNPQKRPKDMQELKLRLETVQHAMSRAAQAQAGA